MTRSDQQMIQEAAAQALICISQAVGREPLGSVRWPLLAEAFDAVEKIAAVAFGARDAFTPTMLPDPPLPVMRPQRLALAASLSRGYRLEHPSRAAG